MDAEVYRTGRDWFVSFTVAGVEVDTAGPFDDEQDAELAAARHGRLPTDPNTGYPLRPGAPLSWSGGSYPSAREKRLTANRVVTQPQVMAVAA